MAPEPGMGTTVWPASQAASTSRPPGSLTVGVPASLTSTTSPAPSAASTRCKPRPPAGARQHRRAVAQVRLTKAVPRQQPRGDARVLGGDRTHFPEHAERAQRHVLEVADRRGDDVEGAQAPPALRATSPLRGEEISPTQP